MPADVAHPASIVLTLAQAYSPHAVVAEIAGGILFVAFLVLAWRRARERRRRWHDDLCPE